MNKKRYNNIRKLTSSKRFPNKIFKKIIKLNIELIIKRIKKINLKKYNYEIIVNTSSIKVTIKSLIFVKKNKYFRK